MVAPVVKKPRSRLTPADEAHEHALAQVEEQFRDFDLVWAKVGAYPWWPAVLFHDWDVVRDAGIPTLERRLVLPEPSIVPVLDADGNDTGRTRLLRHCVVMFVDQFNFSVVELDSKSVGSFLAYYKLHTDAMARNKKAGKYRAQFRIALDKALRMLHMGNDFNPDDLPLLEPIQVEQPPKKRRTEAARPPQSKRRNDVTDAWEGEWESEQEDDGDDSDEYKPRSQKRSSKKAAESDSSETPAPKRTGSKKSAQSKRDASSTKSKGIVKRSEKHGKTAARSRAVDKAAVKADAAVVAQDIKQKKPRKEKKGTAVDLTQMADSDEISDESKEPAVMTPLSSIWTTKVPVESSDDTPALAFKQDFVWDSSVFCDNDTAPVNLISSGVNGEAASVASSENPASGGRERPLSKRQGRSMQQSQIRQNLMSGNLDPHTMVQCESYKLAMDLDSQNSRSRGAANLPPPFKVIVHPDATFVCDLHAHLATCEIIGFLGGKWDEETKTLYIQAAFPCRSLMIDGDDGSTDVEMDPGSEIELRGIINDAELEVVGWYHSHPAFAPDPSIRDIENQASYQQLFKRTQHSHGNEKAETSEPFVGLIVGTYDTRRDTPVSLFRYFHVRGEKVSGGARREIFMPYEFIPERRHYRQVVSDMASHKIRGLPIYPAVLKALMLSQSFRPATSLSSPISKEDESESQLISVSKPSPVRKKAPTSVRKRKQSADISVGEASGKRGKRVRKKKTEESTATEEIDLTMDDDNEAAIQEGVSATDSSVEIIDVTRSGDNNVEMQSDIDNNAKVVEMSESQLRSGRTTSNEDYPDRMTSKLKVDSKNDQPICEKATTDIAITKMSNGAFKLPEDKVKTGDDDIGKTKANLPVTTSVSDHTATATAPENVSLPASNQSLNPSTDRRTGAAGITTLSSKPKPAPTVIVETSSAVVRGATSSPSSSVTSNGSGGRRRNRKPSVTNKNKWRTDRSPQSESAVNASETMASPLNAFITIGSSRSSSTRSEATPPSPASLEAKKQKDENESLREIAKDPEYFVFGEADVKAVASSSPEDSSETHIIASADTTISSNTPATADDCSTDDDIEIVAVDESKPVVDEIVPCSQGSGLSDATPIITTSNGHSGGDACDVVEEQRINSMLTTSDISLVVSERLEELVQEVAQRSVHITIKLEDTAVEEPKSTDGLCGSATVMIDGNLGDLGVETESMKTEDVYRKTEPGEASVGVQTIGSSEQNAEASSSCQTAGALEPTQELFPEAKDDERLVPAAPSEIIKTEEVPAEHITTIATAPTSEPSEKVKSTTALEPLLFGRDRKCEDVRTSLEKMEQLKLEKPSLFAQHVKNARPARRQSERSSAVESNPKPSDHLFEEAKAVHSPEEQLEAHLTALRSRYGDGMFGCVEQVVTLVDYYRDFERRIDLLEPWKAKMNKLRKIEASLSEYVQYLNLSVDLRRAFIDDLIGYLELSWELTRHAR